MKRAVFSIILVLAILLCGMRDSGLRTYIQVKDIAAQENGAVKLTQKKANLFECTYKIDLERKIITRTSIRRLDEKNAHPDATEYTLMKRGQIMDSPVGKGGDVFIAVQKNGSEIIQLGHRYALTARFSPFSQVITGIYKRVHHHAH